MTVIYNSRICRLLPSWVAAITLAEWICIRGPSASNRLLRHEARHVRQWRWFGYVLFPVAYLVGWALAGFSYAGNWFERDARAHEQI